MKHGCVLRFLLILECYFHITHAKFIKGHIETKENWIFISRFCFLSLDGRLDYEIEYPASYGTLSILLYYDDADQWPAVYKSDKTCDEKVNMLNPSNHQEIRLIPDMTNKWSGCRFVNSSGGPKDIYREPFYSCKSGRKFKAVRQRWWFIAASNCQQVKGLDIKYKILMTNADPHERFLYHFSADEFYILQTDITFLFLFLTIGVISVIFGNMLKSRQLLHSTYKLYMLSLFFECTYILFMCLAFGLYSDDGVSQSSLILFGRFQYAASKLIFLLVLILMGKGFTITRGRLSNSGSIKIAVFMTIYVVTYIVLFIYETHFFDPGEVLYLYESPPGYGLIALRLLGWLWFSYAIFFTLKHYPDKGSFYYPLFILYTLWFWAGPCVILISNFAMDKWVREKVANGVNMSLDFMGLFYFLILTRPTAANKNFPYHVRTTQIGIMRSSNAPTGTSLETDSFSTNPYEAPPPPSYTELFGCRSAQNYNAMHHQMDIFTVTQKDNTTN